MSVDFLVKTGYKILTPSCCGVSFAMQDSIYDLRRNDRNGWYCPNCGSSRVFTGQTEEAKLRAELEKKERQLKWANEYKDEARAERDKVQRKLITTKGHITRIKNRIGNGVCPCCNRTFKDLQNHMKSKHPQYKKEVA